MGRERGREFGLCGFSVDLLLFFWGEEGDSWWGRYSGGGGGSGSRSRGELVRALPVFVGVVTVTVADGVGVSVGNIHAWDRGDSSHGQSGACDDSAALAVGWEGGECRTWSHTQGGDIVHTGWTC